MSGIGHQRHAPTRADRTQDCSYLTFLDKGIISLDFFSKILCYPGVSATYTTVLTKKVSVGLTKRYSNRDYPIHSTPYFNQHWTTVTMNRSAPTVGHSRAVDQTIRNEDSIRVRGQPTETDLEPFGEVETCFTFHQAATDNKEKTPPLGGSKQTASAVQAPLAATPSDPGFAPEASRETLRLGFHALNALDGADIPEYVREHNATLSFPETVRVNNFPSLPVLASMSNKF
jgi:hypothetical protein